MAQGRTYSVTATPVTVATDFRHLLLSNDGTENVYVHIKQKAGVNSPASADNSQFFHLEANDIIVMDCEEIIYFVSMVTESGKTSSLRMLGWK